MGANANIAGNLRIGANATIGNNLSIGANLSVTGLITAGDLIANTVNTFTLIPNSVTSGLGSTTQVQQIVSSPTANTYITIANVGANVTTLFDSQSVFLWASTDQILGLSAAPGPWIVEFRTDLIRQNPANVVTIVASQIVEYASGNATTQFDYYASFPGLNDIPPTGNVTYNYSMRWKWRATTGSGACTYFDSTQASLLTLGLKR